MANEMPDSKTILPILKGVARFASQEEYLSFCENFLSNDFFIRMKRQLVDLWLLYHGSPEDE